MSSIGAEALPEPEVRDGPKPLNGDSVAVAVDGEVTAEVDIVGMRVVAGWLASAAAPLAVCGAKSGAGFGLSDEGAGCHPGIAASASAAGEADTGGETGLVA